MAKEFDLQTEWQRQAEIVAKRFAPEVGLTVDEYIGRLPDFPQEPHEIGGMRFNMPLIVPTHIGEISLSRMLMMEGVLAENMNPREIIDWQDDPHNSLLLKLPILPG